MSVGIVFDIDGVLMHDWHAIGKSDEALQRVKNALRLPVVFVTNGGGVPEAAKQASLPQLLGIDVLLEQVILCHTPFRARWGRRLGYPPSRQMPRPEHRRTESAAPEVWY